MQSLEKRIADRKARAEAQTIGGASRADLQKQAEDTVLAKDKAAGLKSAPLASQAKPEKAEKAKDDKGGDGTVPSSKAAGPVADPFAKK